MRGTGFPFESNDLDERSLAYQWKVYVVFASFFVVDESFFADLDDFIASARVKVGAKFATSVDSSTSTHLFFANELLNESKVLRTGGPFKSGCSVNIHSSDIFAFLTLSVLFRSYIDPLL